MKTFDILILIAVFLLWTNQLIFWGYDRIKERKRLEKIKQIKESQRKRRYQKRKNNGSKKKV